MCYTYTAVATGGRLQKSRGGDPDHRFWFSAKTPVDKKTGSQQMNVGNSATSRLASVWTRLLGVGE